MCIYYDYFIYLIDDWNRGSLYLGTNTNSVVINILINVIVCTYANFIGLLGVVLLGHMIYILPVIQSSCDNLDTLIKYKSYFYSISLPILANSREFNVSHPSGYFVVS